MNCQHTFVKALVLLCFAIPSFAGEMGHRSHDSRLAGSQPTFSLVATTPTYITVPANRQAHIQYKVTNNTAITRTLTMVPIPNVTQLTNDSSQCPNPFILAKNQSCNLTLLVDGASQTSTYSGGPVVCKTKSDGRTPDPFLCSQPNDSMQLYIYPASAVTPTLHKLYVSNWDGNSISLCYINSGGDLQHCLVSAVSNTFANPEALAVGGDFLFVANIGGGMSSCAIDSITGELSNCKNATNNLNAAQIYAPDGIKISGSTAYISNAGGLNPLHEGVTACTVGSGDLTACAFTQGNANFSTPSDLALLTDTVYVTNFQSVYTTYCQAAGGLCGTSGTVNTSPPDLLNEPEGLFITRFSSIDYAYFTNHGNNTVTLCQVTTGPSLTNCSFTDGYFTGFGNLTILNNPLKAYIPSGLKTISICDVDGIDGMLSNCVNSTELGFNNPSGLVIK